MQNEKNRNFDVIIIGAGVAGLSAALWCDELRLDALVLEQSDQIGGQLLWTYNPIHNHLGAIAENGRELRDKFAAQLQTRKFELRLTVKIDSVDLAEKVVVLKNGESLSAKFIILATGIRRRKLGIAGEDEFIGKGILASGKRDSEKVAGKKVLVVGGGDAACENALILAEKATKVWLAHRRREFRARREFLAQIAENPKIETLLDTSITKILGHENVEAVELQRNNDDKPFQLNVEAVLIRIGVMPSTELFDGQINLDSNNYIETDKNSETNLKGIFAIGDVANPLSPTISTAIGDGASVIKFLFTRL